MSTQKRKTILNNPLVGAGKSKSVQKEVASQPPKKSTKSKSNPVKKPENQVPDIMQKKMGAEEIFSTGMDMDTSGLASSAKKSNSRAVVAVRAEEILEGESKLGAETLLSIKSTSLSSVRAVRIVKIWSWLTVPASFIPLPLIDSAALIGLQIKMISELCKCYGVPFKKESVNAIISGLLGGTMAATLASGLRRGALKHIPHVGYVASAVTEPILNFSSTYAIGSIFIQHFEKNGDLNNFNFDHVRGSFASYMEKGKLIFKFKSAKK